MTDQEARDEREALRNDIARTIHDGPSAVIELATMMIAPHSWEECPHKATYLGDADALVAAGYRKHPEPEVEYEVTYSSPQAPSIDGYRLRCSSGILPTLDAAEQWAAVVDNPRVQMRTKAVPAGPWVPVGEGER
ncbi:hypothetical protein ACFVR6_03755 [Microbacterium sp. NPDC058021]|uniref:hypothetical protein n=1 Tax=Microbacterium sp. NPDC058021 TaxID=3346306 RepID=UPI0036D7FF66